MLKAIIVFATILVAVVLATQPLEQKERNHHLDHEHQLSQHHQEFQKVRHTANEHTKHGKNHHEVPSHVKDHQSHGHSTSQRKVRQAKHDHGHKKSLHQKDHHQKDHHTRKVRSHAKAFKSHHKRHTGSGSRRQ